MKRVLAGFLLALLWIAVQGPARAQDMPPPPKQLSNPNWKPKEIEVKRAKGYACFNFNMGITMGADAWEKLYTFGPEFGYSIFGMRINYGYKLGGLHYIELLPKFYYSFYVSNSLGLAIVPSLGFGLDLQFKDKVTTLELIAAVGLRLRYDFTRHFGLYLDPINLYIYFYRYKTGGGASGSNTTAVLNWQLSFGFQYLY